MDWKDCKRAFYVDGSLRDIYVHGTTRVDWDQFLKLLSSLEAEGFVNGQLSQLPKQATEIFEQNGDTSFLAKFEISNVKLNCHFFTVDEIELDIDPKEVTSQQGLDAVVEILALIGKKLGKDVVLTDENTPASRWLIYENSTSKVKFINE